MQVKIFTACVNLWFSFLKEKAMIWKIFCRKFIPFSLTFLLGLFAFIIPQKFNSLNDSQILIDKEPSKTKIIYSEKGPRGSGICPGPSFSENKIHIPKKSTKSNDKKLQILFKPLAGYTDEARVNNIQGTVLLRVLFLANGKLGNITVVKPLPYGLTEKAVESAGKIKFEPQTKDEKPISVLKTIQYTFTIY
jgi:TonB family protein